MIDEIKEELSEHRRYKQLNELRIQINREWKGKVMQDMIEESNKGIEILQKIKLKSWKWKAQ
jgi:stage III sporulation protein SpoIIIAA